MSTTARILMAGALCLIAADASAQDFLGGLARRAAEATATRLVERAVDGVVNGAPRQDTPDARGARPAAPSAQDSRDPALDRLTEEQREVECSRRVPLDPDGGRSFEKQQAFGRCMGPRWGEGA